MNKLKLLDLLHSITYQLLPTYKDENLSHNYAWFLVEKLCNKTKTQLIIEQTFSLSPEQNNQLEEWMYLLTQKKMPIQYILGSVPFDDLDILVHPPILIPRPETEEWIINLVNQLKKLHNQQLQILDLATGSGCIALALAHHLPQSHATATDISSTALELAKKNSFHNNIHNVTFLQSDLFDLISFKYDLIVANPPYIAFSERKDLDDSVTQWEDEHALFAPDDGLAIIKKIIDAAPTYIQQNKEMKQLNIPQLAIEIGYKQGNIVKSYMIAAGYNDVHIYKDLEQKERVVAGRIDNVANSNATK